MSQIAGPQMGVVLAATLYLGLLSFTGAIIYTEIKLKKDSKLEQKAQNEMIINSIRVDTTNYQTSFNYFDYFKKTHQ